MAITRFFEFAITRSRENPCKLCFQVIMHYWKDTCNSYLTATKPNILFMTVIVVEY